MTREQLIQRTTGVSGLKMKGQDLGQFDFSGLDLTGADFSFSDLSRANFEGAILKGADLSFASLTGVNFTNTDLSNADLRFSDLSGVAIDGANLTGAKMNFSSISAKRDPLSARSEPITLATLLKQPGWGLLTGMILGALVVYGFSSIIYFTGQIVITKDQVMAALYRFLIAQNILIGATTFLLVWTIDRWLDQTSWKLWAKHALVSALTVLTCTTVSVLCFFWLGYAAVTELRQRPDYSDDNAPGWIYTISYVLVANCVLYLLNQGRQVTRKLSEQEFQLLTMEKLKTRAELDALQAKINPHFLYNSLNSIASLVHEDPDKAESMTLHLSKLFRYTTGRDGSHFSSLAEELDMVQTYLKVEAVRFGDRLTFTISSISEAISQAQIPQFLLQPVVENAIKHGVAKRADGGLINIDITERNGWLTLCVHDNGPAFPETMGAGYGLRSIQDKLRLLYGEAAAVSLQNEPIKQVVIKLKIA
ncbi:pentapeptide repeat-containing protein [Fibrella forsythiae]|uniref:Histidine kinase n=1 Tax=Fibrella forsythiae TaxID=2817061 RepID=A0ABS3JB27_9BACT|nr:pentapeptide repeat-containing protein [Fibrella forsythiae]MBO0947197.1 histidine kinase [Fibrella forsythiae]